MIVVDSMKFEIRRVPSRVALLCLLQCSIAHADFYTCKDNAGHIITSDRPIPECAAKSTQVYQNNGILKNQLSAEPTPEQRKALLQQQQEQAKEAAHQEEIRQEQRYLTAHYPNEAAIDTARKKALDAVEAKIATETRTIESANEDLRKTQNAINLTPKDQVAKLQELKLKGDDLTQSIEESTRLVGNYRNEEAAINKQFDDTHKRYHELIPAYRQTPASQ